MRAPFFVLLLSCLVVGLSVGLPLEQVVVTIGKGFWNIIKALGLIIILGIILGAILEVTGSTRVMAAAILKRVGERRAPLAMSLTGFIVGMPIFCDSGFIVLSGLNRSLAARTRIPMAFMTVSLASGLYSIHCLIPPHPGASAAAGLIGVDVGHLMVAGILVALPAAFVGYCWARYAGRDRKKGGRDAAAGGKDPAMGEPVGGAGKESVHPKGPSVPIAFLPVAVPILLIAIKSFFTVKDVARLAGSSWLLALGYPPIALSVGILLALAGGKRWTGKTLGGLLRDSLKKAAGILVIIGAGGAFGAVLATTHMGERLSTALPLARLGLFFPFLLTSLLKTAQGSSTVAIITSASIVKPLLTILGLAAGNGPLLCILSMGAGSMMISHANDAYFWVIARFSGLELTTMLRVYTVATLLMGLTALLTIYLIARIL